jgi:glycosyltransferase involved in cell wall biosynthesis
LKRIVLHWPRLGPYHLARLRGAHELFDARGVMVTALEIAGMDRTYGWKKEEKPTVFERRTLFPNGYYEDLSDTELKTAIFAGLDELSPDAVAINGYGFRDSRICLDWCNSRETKAILMTETTAADKPRFWMREVAKRILLRRFDVAICGGQRHRDYLLSLGTAPYRVFTKYDVVDNAYFSNAARVNAKASALPGLNDPRPFFLASNRFIARKNLRTLVQAYARYRLNAPDGWRLVLLGSGEQEAELRKLVADLAVPDVTFAGFRQIEELPSYYAAAGCFIHPALIEPWGLVVNEAMAAGLPVIVSTGAGCADDLVEHGANGFVFDPADVSDLARCMTTLAGDAALQTRMRARSREIIARWTVDDFAKSLWKAWEAPRIFYRLVTAGQRNVVAYPERSIACRLQHVRCFRPVTIRQQLLFAGIRIVILLRCDRWMFRRTAPDDPLNFSSDMANTMREVSSRLEREQLFYTLAWPSEARRRRTYAFVLSDENEPFAFIKMSEAGEREALTNGFDALTKLAELRQGAIRFPRPFFLGKCGVVDYYASQYVPLKRARRSLSSLNPKVPIESYSGPVTVMSPEQLAKARWVSQFWNVVDERSSFASRLRDDFQYPAQCCLVHGDLTRANLIPSGNAIWIIDWELGDPFGPWMTDYITFFLGERQRRLVHKPVKVMAEFRQKFLSNRTSEDQRNARLAVAFLLGRGSGLGRRIVAAWGAVE